MGTTSRRTDPWTRLASALVVLIVVAEAMVVIVHYRATGDWWARPVPTTVQYGGRDYACREEGRTPTLPADAMSHLLPRGVTLGGGVILAADILTAPTVIVVAGEGGFAACSLSGGP